MPKRIPVVEKILSANDRLALKNQSRFDAAKVFAINVMASPGAGKTSLIEHTIKGLEGRLRIGMINGDIATSFDADRAQAAGATAIQINTGGNCHLDAVMVQLALSQLDLSALDLVIIENVGNLVCPADFKLGTHKSVLVASIPEGDDKPYKYPGMYRGVNAVVINKIDLLPYVPFRMDFFKKGIEVLNPGVTQFELSCRTGEGLSGWLAWLEGQVKEFTGYCVPYWNRDYHVNM
ncbi:MAG: hydrogenase nickel incorporation protein HypB [Candidatus Atribacteria bacterium]|nr:hydrogenase nickel incorporation protein HypB [Candidatus Atribacteria bacterium]